eukprot:12371543-Ditylum_brightwellii.AAC.1
MQYEGEGKGASSVVNVPTGSVLPPNAKFAFSSSQNYDSNDDNNDNSNHNGDDDDDMEYEADDQHTSYGINHLYNQYKNSKRGRQQQIH